MQVGIDVTCMHTNFGGCGFFGFGDIATFKRAKFPFLTMDYSPWSSKNLIDRNRLKKFMQVVIDVKYMHINFGGRDLSGFGDIAISKTAKFPFLSMDYSPWSSKNLIDRNRLTYFTLFLKYFHNHSLDFVSQWNSWRTKNELTSKALIFMHSNRFYKLILTH